MVQQMSSALVFLSPPFKNKFSLPHIKLNGLVRTMIVIFESRGFQEGHCIRRHLTHLWLFGLRKKKPWENFLLNMVYDIVRGQQETPLSITSAATFESAIGAKVNKPQRSDKASRLENGALISGVLVQVRDTMGETTIFTSLLLYCPENHWLWDNTTLLEWTVEEVENLTRSLLDEDDLWVTGTFDLTDLGWINAKRARLDIASPKEVFGRSLFLHRFTHWQFGVW